MVWLGVSSGCGGPPIHDAGVDAGAAPMDAGPLEDAASDAGRDPRDAGSPSDAASDGGAAPDASSPDASSPDGAVDAGVDGGGPLCPSHECEPAHVGRVQCGEGGAEMVCTELASDCHRYVPRTCPVGERCTRLEGSTIFDAYGCSATCRSADCDRIPGAGPLPFDRCDSNVELILRCERNPADGCVDWRIVESCERAATGDFCADATCVSCLDFCDTPGESFCTGNRTYSTCADHDGDGCVEFESFDCPAGEQCEGGACVCEDLCTVEGAVRCAGYRETELCTDHDGDGCREWGAAAACGAGETCWTAERECRPGCRDECPAGNARCLNDAEQTCADHDSDGCTEYDDFTPCPSATPTCLNAQGCVECIGGVECAPGFDECNSNLCEPVPGTCYEAALTPLTLGLPGPSSSGAVDLDIVVPDGFTVADTAVFLHMVGLGDGGEALDLYVRSPASTSATVWLQSFVGGDGYVDTYHRSIKEADVPALSVFEGEASQGTWTVRLVNSGGESLSFQSVAICLR